VCHVEKANVAQVRGDPERSLVLLVLLVLDVSEHVAEPVRLDYYGIVEPGSVLRDVHVAPACVRCVRVCAERVCICEYICKVALYVLREKYAAS
jgi:hypothetical protein